MPGTTKALLSKPGVIPPEQMPPSPRPRIWVTVGRVQSYPHFPGLLLDVRASRPSSLCRIAGGEHTQLVGPLAGEYHPRCQSESYRPHHRQSASLPPSPHERASGHAGGATGDPRSTGMLATRAHGRPKSFFA